MPDWPRWVEVQDSKVLPYRFSVEGRQIDRAQLSVLLDSIRAVLSPLGCADQPSAYICEVILSYRGEHPELYFRPTFMPDERFTYRQGDVGASINPVFAANLVRLSPSTPGQVVVDPTCGSGTLLIERALVEKGQTLIGIDVSPTAIAIAKQNIIAARIAVDLQLANSANISCWPLCDMVLANLPFGNRASPRGDKIDKFYKSIVANAASRMRPGGRAVFATASKTAFEVAVSSAKRTIKLLARYRAQSGGLWVHIFVLGMD
jgi:23S rRNA G2445 N2-methylase RlmL